MGAIILPDSFFNLHQAQLCMDIFKMVGLDGYFKLAPSGLDFQRAYELITTISEDGVATLTNKGGEEVQVQISKALISKALKLPSSKQAIKLPYHLTEKEKKDTFLVVQGKEETFNDLLVKEIDLPLWLYL